MRNPNHIVVEEDGKQKIVVKIVEKNNRNNVVLQFCLDFLQEVQIEDDQLPIQAIYNLYENKKEFSGNQLKEMLLLVTMGLEKLDKKIEGLRNKEEDSVKDREKDKVKD